MNQTKWCRGHKQEHPIEQFGKRSAEADGLHYYCKTYVNEKAAKQRDKPGERAKRATAERERRKRPEVKQQEADRRAKPENRENARSRTEK